MSFEIQDMMEHHREKMNEVHWYDKSLLYYRWEADRGMIYRKTESGITFRIRLCGELHWENGHLNLGSPEDAVEVANFIAGKVGGWDFKTKRWGEI